MQQLIEKWLPNVSQIPDVLLEETIKTLYMVSWSSVIGGLFGLLLGVLLVVVGPGGIYAKPICYQVLDKMISLFRSLPFIILLALLASTTRFLVGTTIGEQAALVPLIIAIIPYFGRQVENALLAVDAGVIEAAEAMGTHPLAIIMRVYLVEGLVHIVRAAAVTMINVIGLTAMAGAVGAGGLGNLAIARGYNRFQHDVTLVATVLLLIIVFVSQALSRFVIKKISH